MTELENPLKGQSGPFEHFYENGQLQAKGYVEVGEPDGPWIYYYENGQEQEKKTYEKGKLVGLFEEFYENGQLKR